MMLGDKRNPLPPVLFGKLNGESSHFLWSTKPNQGVGLKNAESHTSGVGMREDYS